MDKLSYRRHRFPRVVIQQAVWLYFRFALSYRDVEDMLAERGIDVSYDPLNLGDEGPIHNDRRIKGQRFSCPCRKLVPHVLVMQSTQDRPADYPANGLDRAPDRRILVQG